MKLRKYATSSPRKCLEEQNHELIMRHALDPDHSPLSPSQQEQYKRVVQAAKLFDDYPDERHVINLMKEKYPVSLTQIRKDIALAKELFKTQHTFDWDLWHIWELKDQLDLIKRCRDKEDFKNWNAAKKHLRDILGSKPEAVEDPRRMEKNVFYIQVNNGTNQQLNIPLDTIRSLSADDRRIILENMSEPLDEADADQIFDS